MHALTILITVCAIRCNQLKPEHLETLSVAALKVTSAGKLCFAIP